MALNALSAGNSSQNEYTLTYVIEPPTAVRPGVAFTIPVIVTVRPVGATGSDPLQQLGVSASLRDESGANPAAGLSGSTPSSVRSRMGNTTSGYANVGRLKITNPGKYRLRVTLVANAASGVTKKGVVDSGVIHVNPGAAASQRPSMSYLLKSGHWRTLDYISEP